MHKEYEALSDFALMSFISTNDEEVFTTLFNRYFKRLYGFAQRLLSDTETAKELAMDVMFRLWEKRDQFVLDEKQTLQPYLFRSIRNAVMNHLRKTTILTLPLENNDDIDFSIDMSADTNIHLKELETAYNRALSLMPEQRRKIFLMSREEDLTYAEIAERLGISIHTVRNQISASIDFLRRKIMENPQKFDLILTLVFIYDGFLQ